MSIQVMAEVWKYSKNGGSALLVELAIADHVNGAGLCWPSIKHLAKKTKLSTRQVIRVIKKLEQSGELMVIKDRHYNQYRLRLNHDILSVGDKMSYSDENEGDIQGGVDDTQGTDSDTQGGVGDTQGTDSDMATSHKSLINPQENHNLIVKETIVSSQFSEKDPGETIFEKLLSSLEHEKGEMFRQLEGFTASLTEDALIIWVHTEYQVKYCTDHYARSLERKLVGILSRQIIVKFAVKMPELIAN